MCIHRIVVKRYLYVGEYGNNGLSTRTCGGCEAKHYVMGLYETLTCGHAGVFGIMLRVYPYIAARVCDARVFCPDIGVKNECDK